MLTYQVDIGTFLTKGTHGPETSWSIPRMFLRNAKETAIEEMASLGTAD
jgi:hypothetical protein